MFHKFSLNETSYETLDSLIQVHNNLIYEMVESMEEYYNSKCNDDVRECLPCSYNSCSETLPDFVCLTLGVPNDTCLCPE